ncbi:nucleoside-diphosphate sugar epimerase/dehydratase [Pusillimonas sp. NJUB218]|uniref:polysaccharide biosynthesis protein n=1 Tax=Pusillimonas sp. NJUB218 TaxID=2023230 RepID=UPI000F4C23E9|nr:nucleoside-diphosphate sugar epimerase/dehydratase [Pusillimonas sp. NJUB218]ROT46374.1 polysaccharide biosynthesis protein [Pusillimonas sp. NJUB218]
MKSLRSTLVLLFDLLCVVAAWLGAFLLRFNFEWPYGYEKSLGIGLIPLLITQAIACRWAGLYRGMWIFASIPDLRRVLKAVASSAVVLLIVASLAPQHVTVPRSIVLLYPILLLLLMGGGRIAWRMYKEHRLYNPRRGQGKPVVVIGAGTAGAMLVRELERSPDWQVVAIVDDDPGKWGLEVAGCRVEGGTNTLEQTLIRHEAQHAILASTSANRNVLQQVTQAVSHAKAQLFTVPGLNELMSGRVAINAMRPVKIEDLLGRAAVNIDAGNVAEILKGKRLLVTGAGGSIGSELCRQLARFDPALILLLDASEFALYSIEQWFRTNSPGTTIVPLAGDVKDNHRLQIIFDEWRPQVVFHAAAYKHVPLMEDHNAWQALRTNTLGTWLVGQHALRLKAERFVLISTDKAVNPTNVMGATKRMAEMACEVLQRKGNGTTCFQMVRFGNVLGSTGSVIPKFQEQIANGGPVTVTHPEITRYFMSIPEAAQLVLQASSMGKGGEIFVLDMGEPIKIIDLAKNMIRLSGFNEEDIAIQFTGLRPGEKLYEELLANNEHTVPTHHDKLRIAQARSVAQQFDTFLTTLIHSHFSKHFTDQEVRDLLHQWIPEYQPPAESKQSGNISTTCL